MHCPNSPSSVPHLNYSSPASLPHITLQHQDKAITVLPGRGPASVGPGSGRPIPNRLGQQNHHPCAGATAST